MELNPVSVDLAKSVFQLSFANNRYRITDRKRLSRRQMHRFVITHEPVHLIMEACATSHYWGRLAQHHGHQVTLLHANYVRPYVRRNKTDSADADALLQAVQDHELKPVPVKSENHQALQSVHRVREQYKSTRVTYLNLVRALLAEFGIALPKGTGEARMREQVDAVPEMMRSALTDALDHAEQLKQQIKAIDRALSCYAAADPICQQLLPISAIGVTTATALVARVPDIHVFRQGRSFANWLGITAREYSSGGTRRLGGITKRGDTYLRTLLVHCGRSGLLMVRRKVAKDQPLTRLERWAYQTEQRVGHNKAAVAFANKLARVIWAVWSHNRVFDGNDANRFAT